MADFGKASELLSAIRKRVGDVLPRFSPKSKAPAPADDAPLFHSFDPTQALFPGESADDERTGSLPLATLLHDSARAMVRRGDELDIHARRLSARINDRLAAEVTVVTQAVRVLIGLVWFSVAAFLFLAVMEARANGIGVVTGGIPIDDAKVLIRVFLLVSATGLGVAFGVAALAKLFGNADNGRIKKDAEALGVDIAEASSEFDATLTTLRSAMDRRGRPADAIVDLSRAHLTALEACAFFREIGFLAGAEGDQAQRLFKGFLNRPPAGPSSPWPDFLNGVLFGAIIVFMVAVPKPDPVTLLAPVAVMPYPWAAQLLLFGGLAYAVAGSILSLMPGLVTGGVARKAREDALRALRSGFTSREAPRPNDVIRRIEDAVDVFRARVGGGNAGGNMGRTQSAGQNAGQNAGRGDLANQSGDFSGDEQVPEWRRRDSSVKFVDAGFSPAPESWRTDAYAKKFEASAKRETGSKRGGEDLKNRPRD